MSTLYFSKIQNRNKLCHNYKSQDECSDISRHSLAFNTTGFKKEK